VVQRGIVYCSVLQRVVSVAVHRVCCSVLQCIIMCVAACRSVKKYHQNVYLCSTRVAVLLQCVAVCRSVKEYDANVYLCGTRVAVLLQFAVNVLGLAAVSRLYLKKKKSNLSHMCIVGRHVLPCRGCPRCGVL